MKTYQGVRTGPRTLLPEVIVTVDGQPLRHRVRHSPTGFEWGYNGSGPADLALSILWDFIDKEPTQTEYMRFKDNFVAGWGDSWNITGNEIGTWLEFEAEAEFAGA